MRTPDQGKNMLAALHAVQQMHRDASRMLRDCDRLMVGYKSVYASVATMDLSYDVKTGLYMAEGLLRHYVRPDAKDEVIALNVIFFDDSAKVEEPLLVAAKIRYATPLGDLPDRAKAWDPWAAFLTWNQDRQFGRAICLEGPLKKDTVLGVCVAASSLFQIESESALHNLIGLVQNHTFA